MILRLTFCGVLACCRLPVAAADPSAIDPKQYLDQKAYEEAKSAPKADAVRQDVVLIGGRPYYKFGGDGSSILVPKVDRLTQQDMERAVCAEDLVEVCDPSKGGDDPKMEELCKQQGLREAMGVRAQHRLTKETAVYLDLIVATIQTTCGGGGRRPNAKDRIHHLFEIGLERKRDDPRHPGSEKVFIRPNPARPLTPEVGAGVSF